MLLKDAFLQHSAFNVTCVGNGVDHPYRDGTFMTYLAEYSNCVTALQLLLLTTPRTLLAQVLVARVSL